MKEHYKLYKAGKLWLTACIMVAGGIFYAGGGTEPLIAHASVQQSTTSAVAPSPATNRNSSENNVSVQNQSQSNTPTTEQQNTDQTASTTSTQTTNTNHSGTVSTTAPSNTTTPTHSLPVNQAGWNQNGSDWYYVENGSTVKNWRRIDNNWYYFNPQTSLMESGLQSINSRTYYLNERHNGTYGAMLTGWQQANGSWYYFNTNPNNGAAETGWQMLGGRWYYFNPETAMMEAGLQSIRSHTYYLNERHDGTYGAMLTGWQRVNGSWYYFNQNTNDGSAVTGWQRINGRWYYFNNNGRAETGLQTINNRVYAFDTANAWALSGWQKINGSWYYFDANNAWALTNWYQSPAGYWYYFKQNGQAAAGWQWVSDGWYYFQPQNANMLSGWQNVDNTWYYLNPNHDGHYGLMRSGWQFINGQWFYLSPSHNGTFGAMQVGLQVINNNKYYLNPENGHNYGAMLNGWQQINNDWYYFNNSGAAARNWQYINHDWYYFDSQSNIMQTGMKKINGKWYNLNTKHDGSFGAMRPIQSGWTQIDGATYYFRNGSPLVGLQSINNKQYRFDSDGKLISNYYGRITYSNQQPTLTIYDSANNVVSTSHSGTWENVPYSLDSNSINNVQGYVSYSGWYRPVGTSQNGQTWYPTSASDWRPILMYAWPSKDVEAQFIKYFVNHGYVNADYGLTTGTVANLSGNTDQTTLDNTAQNLRYVIEQHIASAKSTGPLSNDINAFMQTVPSLNAKSELSVVYSHGYKPDHSGSVNNDQLIFVNNNSTDQTKGNTANADSQYRLINRTITNQEGQQNVNNTSPELLVGVDIDNSNPAVQAENMNWEYFLLNYGKLTNTNSDGNFDGFRIDAADNVDADVLDQLAQLVNDMYHTKGNEANANNHLLYNEGYHDSAIQMLNSKGNPELYMDSGFFYTLENVLGRDEGRNSIHDLMTNSAVNRQDDSTINEATPNWSFVTNHDQRKNVINQIIIDNHPGVPDIMANGYKAEYAQQAWQEFYADQAKTHKKYAQENLPAQYAILLSNKDTVPQVYYGDLYKETDPYMQTRSMYYDAITTLMKARKAFVSGGQSMTTIGNDLIASVRYGKGVQNATSLGSDALSRTTGMAVVVGNNANMADQTININMGIEHANQQYRNLIDSTADGLTYNGTGSLNPAILTTNANGILTIHVKGYSNPYVSGYLSVWVPVINGTQDASTTANASGQNDKFFESNAALDSHLIYETFSLYQPEPTAQSNRMYNVLQSNASQLADMGITDVWMAPAYSSFSMSRYHEGYSITDRYDLGTNSNPTKYGTGQELANTIAALHHAGMKVQEDIVMNQMLGLSGQEAVTVTRANEHGQQLTVDGQTYSDIVYLAYTRGGGQGQQNYGGKYLSQLQHLYPDLFTTKAQSTGVAPDPTTHITQWSAKYENGTSLQNVGTGMVVKLPNGEYAYVKNGQNNAFDTTLPASMTLANYVKQNEN